MVVLQCNYVEIPYFDMLFISCFNTVIKYNYMVTVLSDCCIRNTYCLCKDGQLIFQYDFINNVKNERHNGKVQRV